MSTAGIIFVSVLGALFLLAVVGFVGAYLGTRSTRLADAAKSDAIDAQMDAVSAKAEAKVAQLDPDELADEWNVMRRPR